jgi:hypothetical protein
VTDQTNPLNNLDVPFEGTVNLELDLSDGIFAGGVILMGAVLDIPDLGPQPALVFRFRLPEGQGFMPPIVLVQDDATTRKFAVLVRDAVDASVRAARIERRT